jgi:hypothetical protein
MLQPCDDLTLTEERAMTASQPERKRIDEVRLVGGPPANGKEVIDYIFQLTEEAAKPLKLHYGCKKLMHETAGPNGETNDQSFDACFKLAGQTGYAASEPQLKVAAYQHGEISRLIQLMLDPESTEVSLKAYEAAGAAVRKLCTVSCTGALGSWCSWP